MKNIIVIGGGAAGFFSAINIAEKHPDYTVTILEKTSKILSKVKISGGGRCNVTHHEFNIKPFSKNYPRGEKQVLKLLNSFQAEDTVTWFSKRGITLKYEADGRMFPVTDSSQTIIDCFLAEIKRLKISVKTNEDVQDIQQTNDEWNVRTSQSFYRADALVISTGSSNSMWSLMGKLGHTIAPPVPSLFTLKIDDSRINDLPGVSFKQVQAKVVGAKTQTEGPLIITHWGLSGPAILKLSAWGAIELAEKNYQFTLSINFTELNFDDVKTELNTIAKDHAKKLIENIVPFNLPKRYWISLLTHLGIKPDNRWGDLGAKSINKLSEELTNAQFKVSGKSTFKDEFVTCGGIDLNEVDITSMKSKLFPHLYFAGEVVNIDAITGGFNFQNAWSTSWVVSENI